MGSSVKEDVGAEDGGSVVISSGAEDTADDVDASGSLDGGAVAWIFVEEADGEEAWGVRSFASLHPAREMQRIRDKNSGSKRFMIFTTSYIFVSFMSPSYSRSAQVSVSMMTSTVL